VDIGLLGFLASLRGWYFGKGSGYRALWDIWPLPKAAILEKVVDIVGILGFLASVMGKVVDIVGLLGFLAHPLCLPTLGWDLKSERPNILETSCTKAHFTLGVRAERTWGHFEHFLLVVWPQVINKC
jgi:hypothetical protein